MKTKNNNWTIESLVIQKIYPGYNEELLLTVAAATPNFRRAVEILCGIYRQPDFAETPVNQELFDKRYKNIKYSHFDPFTDTIHFTCNKLKSKEGWVKKDLENPTIEDIIPLHWQAEKAAKELELSIDDFKEIYSNKRVLSTEFETDSNNNPLTYMEECPLTRWLGK